MTDMRNKVISSIKEIGDVRGVTIIDRLNEDTILLESGLDSRGFAILVAQLEEDLGYDPFVLMDEPVYPKTLGEFVSIYERFAPK